MKYKYEAIGDCGTKTSTNTCCSNGSWSGWDEDCPKDCTGEQPAARQACFSGYQTRTVTCVNGSWQTGAWSQCDCTNSQYEWVDLPNNQGKCCQDTRCGTTGSNGEAYTCCARGQEEIPWRWVEGGNVYCNGFDQGSSVESCGTCNAQNNNAECRVRNSSLSLGGGQMALDCTLYMCRQ